MVKTSNSWRPLISPAELASRLDDADTAVLDCRFSLADVDEGEQQYVTAHIPGAVYVHLERDLSGPIEAGRTGRHPLPDIETVAGVLGGLGIDKQVAVVAYDAAGGAFAARLWWQLRQLGHDRVAVLDGGWPAWTAEGRPARKGRESRPARTFTPRPRPDRVVDAAQVSAALAAGGLVLDARGAERYRGEQEPIDRVAGHIPGARSAPFAENLGEDGHFLPQEALRERFDALLGAHPPEETILYCGSGVTGAHDVLAMAAAGLPLARLYAGSWSDWITDPSRPVATGPEPVPPAAKA
jgi:thiosulfate/3-mercaptopyruvate sulfurtransferase